LIPESPAGTRNKFPLLNITGSGRRMDFEDRGGEVEHSPGPAHAVRLPSLAMNRHFFARKIKMLIMVERNTDPSKGVFG
jgi:hypothetical protein